ERRGWILRGRAWRRRSPNRQSRKGRLRRPPHVPPRGTLQKGGRSPSAGIEMEQRREKQNRQSQGLLRRSRASGTRREDLPVPVNRAVGLSCRSPGSLYQESSAQGIAIHLTRA